MAQLPKNDNEKEKDRGQRKQMNNAPIPFLNEL